MKIEMQDILSVSIGVQALSQRETRGIREITILQPGLKFHAKNSILVGNRAPLTKLEEILRGQLQEQIEPFHWSSPWLKEDRAPPAETRKWVFVVVGPDKMVCDGSNQGWGTQNGRNKMKLGWWPDLPNGVEGDGAKGRNQMGLQRIQQKQVQRNDRDDWSACSLASLGKTCSSNQTFPPEPLKGLIFEPLVQFA